MDSPFDPCVHALVADSALFTPPVENISGKCENKTLNKTVGLDRVKPKVWSSFFADRSGKWVMWKEFWVGY